MRYGFPQAGQGMRIGLLGGSFDPPHAGHVHISRWALRNFRLDQVWWLVSPGNPLKSRQPAPLAHRIAAAEALATHPRIRITDLEARLATRYTADTLTALQARYPGVRFVWLMGADNLAEFHRWDRWDWIMENMNVGVMSRPEEQVAAGLSPAARRYARFRLSPRRAAALPLRRAPCWTLLTGRMLDISSTEIRARGGWPKGQAVSGETGSGGAGSGGAE